MPLRTCCTSLIPQVMMVSRKLEFLTTSVLKQLTINKHSCGIPYIETQVFLLYMDTNKLVLFVSHRTKDATAFRHWINKCCWQHRNIEFSSEGDFYSSTCSKTLMIPVGHQYDLFADSIRSIIYRKESKSFTVV